MFDLGMKVLDERSRMALYKCCKNCALPEGTRGRENSLACPGLVCMWW